MARASGHFIPLIPQAILDCPPSVADKTLSYDEELGQRLFGCEWIQKASILLSVRTEAMCNGQITFHRFYYKRSMREFDVKV
jgi:cyclin L